MWLSNKSYNILAEDECLFVCFLICCRFGRCHFTQSKKRETSTCSKHKCDFALHTFQCTVAKVPEGKMEMSKISSQINLCLRFKNAKIQVNVNAIALRPALVVNPREIGNLAASERFSCDSTVLCCFLHCVLGDLCSLVSCFGMFLVFFFYIYKDVTLSFCVL